MKSSVTILYEIALYNLKVPSELKARLLAALETSLDSINDAYKYPGKDVSVYTGRAGT